VAECTWPHIRSNSSDYFNNSALGTIIHCDSYVYLSQGLPFVCVKCWNNSSEKESKEYMSLVDVWLQLVEACWNLIFFWLKKFGLCNSWSNYSVNIVNLQNNFQFTVSVHWRFIGRYHSSWTAIYTSIDSWGYGTAYSKHSASSCFPECVSVNFRMLWTWYQVRLLVWLANKIMYRDGYRVSKLKQKPLTESVKQ